MSFVQGLCIALLVAYSVVPGSTLDLFKKTGKCPLATRLKRCLNECVNEGAAKPDFFSTIINEVVAIPLDAAEDQIQKLAQKMVDEHADAFVCLFEKSGIFLVSSDGKYDVNMDEMAAMIKEMVEMVADDDMMDYMMQEAECCAELQDEIQMIKCVFTLFDDYCKEGLFLDLI